MEVFSIFASSGFTAAVDTAHLKRYISNEENRHFTEVKGLAIRLATVRDVPDILEIYRPYIENTAITFEYDVPTVDEFRERFLGITAQCPWLVWEENGEILGYAYGAPAFARKAYAWCADLSVYLREDAKGRGIGKALYAELERLLKKQGYRVLYALVTTANKASVAFHRAVGYRIAADFPHCGWKFDQWHGVIWLQKDVGPDTPPTGFPIPFPALEDR